MKIDILETPYHTLGFTYEYNPQVVKYCKLIQSSWGNQEFSFNATYKAWVFSKKEIVEAIISQYPETMVSQEVKSLCGMIEIEQLKEEVKLREMAALKVSDDSSIVISGFMGDLYPFQRVGVEFLVRSGYRAILGDDPGLGKTAQAIGAMLASHASRVLVVCPATMKYTWEAEVKKWSGLTPFVISSSTKISEIDANTNVWIVNYDLLKKHITELIKVKFDMMVLDEAHYIKSLRSLRTRAVRLLSRGIGHIIMLTGTLVLNRPVELFSPLSILDPLTWNNYYRFVNKYCNAHQTRFGLDVSGSSNTEELSQKLDKYLLRRRKEEVLSDLPDKVRVEIPIELDKSYAREYARAYGDFKKFLKEDRGKSETDVKKALLAEKIVRLNALRGISARGKAALAVEVVRNIIEGGEKILVFSSFIDPLKDLSGVFGESSVLITGETPAEERFSIVKKFQEDPSVKVFLGGIKSAGVGITLTRASNVLFLDYSWTPADHKQAEDRAHRIGSEHESITIYQFHAIGTVDDIMKKMLTKKRKIVESLVGEGDDQSAMMMVLEEITKMI